MIAPRYAPALLVLLAVALIPTIIHSYAGSQVTDGLTTDAIAPNLAGYTSAPSGRNAGWSQRRFESFDWFERRYVSGTDEVLLTVIRSYDLKRLYHHPELAVAYGTSFKGVEILRLPSHPDVPIHVLHPDTPSRSMALFVLHYDDGFVDDPIWFQIRTAGRLLFAGRKPMTLLFARDVESPTGASVESLPATSLLFAAVEQFAGSRAAR